MQLDLSSPEGQALFASLVAQGIAQAAALATPPPPPANPLLPAAPARLVSELWAEWARTLRKTPSAFEAHKRYFLQMPFTHDGMQICIGAQPWTALTPRMGHDWWAELRRQKVRGGKQLDENGKVVALDDVLSAAYCNRILTTAQGMFSFHVSLAVKSDSRVRGLVVDEVTENPLRRWPRAQDRELGERLGSFADEEQLNDFISVCRPALGEMVWLACHCGGMRRGEVRQLEWVDVNLDQRTITIPKERSKNGMSRIFPIEDERSFQILAHRHAHNARRRVPSKFVFYSLEHNAGSVVCERTMEFWVAEAARKWGKTLDGESVTFHHCRHTWAKWSLLRETPLNLVMEWGGWESMAVAKKYAKATQAMRDQARKRATRSISEILSAEAITPAPADTRKAPRRARFEASASPTAERISR